MAKKDKAEEKPLHELLPPVLFTPMGAPDKQLDQANLLAARQSPVFLVTGGVVAHCLSKRGERLLLDFNAQACVLRFEVDGVWVNVDPIDRATGDGILAVLKKIANLNPGDRRSKQEGKFGVDYNTGTKYTADIVSQGIPTGERVLIKLTPKRAKFENIEQLGMRDKMREQFKACLDADVGFIIVSAPDGGGGFSTTWRMALQHSDRYVRDFISIEPRGLGDEEVINITQNCYDPDQGFVAFVERLLLKMPDVFVVPEIDNAETMNYLMTQAKNNNKLVITRAKARDTLEALFRFVGLKPKMDDFAKMALCVVNSRMIRKLCDQCKQPYQPQPQLLQKLGIPPGRVASLYKEWTPPPPEQQVDAKGRPIEIPICAKCQGGGYHGRTGIFELLVINDQIRDALLKQPDIESVRRAAKAAGHRSLQEEAILLVAQGLTSVQELQRVFAAK